MGYRKSMESSMVIKVKFNKMIGFYDYEWIELTENVVEDIQLQGGTILGSSRGGFKGKEIVEALISRGINQVYLIGGDGTHRGILELSKEIESRNLKIAVVGLPKTIDNDIPIIDKSFGFETSVSEA
jgi:6-phosphofructokinase 1